MVSKVSAASMCCYGLQAHSELVTSTGTSSICTAIRSLDEKLFYTPWYLRSFPSAVSTNTTVSSGSLGSHNHSNQQTTTRKSAKVLASQHPVTSANVRFSRHSVSESLFRSRLVPELSKAGGGVCLVLCRVLLHRVCTVPGDIFPEDLDIASERGYDSIYSQAK